MKKYKCEKLMYLLIRNALENVILVPLNMFALKIIIYIVLNYPMLAYSRSKNADFYKELIDSLRKENRCLANH